MTFSVLIGQFFSTLSPASHFVTEARRSYKRSSETMQALPKRQIDQAVQRLKQGEVIAYPTEAVYGLGCDPFEQTAVEKLFHVKQRPIEKGIILVAASVDQIKEMVELHHCAWQEKVESTWPGPFTWVLPTKSKLPEWITGGRDTVAIRVSSHPIAKALCEEFGGPIVSSSANLTGEPPAKTCQQIKTHLNDAVFCIDAPLGDLAQPTQIWDAVSQERLR